MRRQSGGAGWWWRGGGAVAWWGAVVLAHLVTPGRAGLLETNPGLAYNFYQTSCPSAEATVKSITWQMVAANPALAGRLLRLHFHDCFVQLTNRWSLSKPALKASSTSKQRSPIELAAALPVLLVPSGFVPGTGEDGRGLSSCFSGKCKGPDCFFQNICKGCDASILLDTPASQNEKSAPPNGSVGGYEVIDAIKTKLEATCPGVVSCADIVALAARDAVSYQFQASLWQVETGRRDGSSSLASNAGALPSFSAGFAGLLASFAAQGLNVTDLVALSGAHTIGKASCSSVTPRLYAGNATSVDPLLDSTLAAVLINKCPNNASSSATTVDLDGNTPLKFDGIYYTNLINKRGLLASDAALMQNAAAAAIVNDLTNPIKFYAAFAMSMKKMGRVNVLTAKNGKGKIRAQCRAP